MVPLLAFSLQDQVEKYGAYIGIAAFFGLAVLTVLYFSQASELRRLREWAGRAPERAQEIEARAVAQADAARRAPAPAARATAATHAAAVAAAAAAVGTATAAAARSGTVGPATPIGAQTREQAESAESAESVTEVEAGAPSSNGAPPGETQESDAVDPDPDEEGKPEAPAATEEGKPEAPAPTEGAATGASSPPPAPETRPDPAPEDEPEAKPASEPPSPGNGSAPEAGQPGEIPVAPVPRATPVPRRTPVPAAPLRAPEPSATVQPRRPVPAAHRAAPAPAVSTSSRRRSRRGTILAVVAGALVLAGGAFAATQLLGGDDPSTPSPNRTSDPTAEPSAGSAGGSSTASSATTQVAVLNGTVSPGLASTKADQIATVGFKRDNISTGNNTDQQRGQSSVLFAAGARRQATAVARVLKVSKVEPLDADTRSLANDADVVVILGADQTP